MTEQILSTTITTKAEMIVSQTTKKLRISRIERNCYQDQAIPP